MSQPHTGAGSDPSHFGQSKTLFVEEGNTACLLYIRRGKLERMKPVQFANPVAALEWCRRRGVGMIYTPLDPARN